MNRTILQIFLFLAFIPLTVLIGYGVLVVAPIFCCFLAINSYKFKNFKESQNFVSKISDIAEDENHHPDITFGWGYCKIKIFTHAIEGLAESDFILAAKIDQI